MYYYHYESEYGVLTICEKNGAITEVCFGQQKRGEERETALIMEAWDQLQEYFQGKRKQFVLPLAPEGTAFQKKVWEALLTVPYGETRTYGQLAEQIGNPKACRAVGMANHKNPIPIMIPCHRVIGSKGNLTGYAGGLALKERLLALEKDIIVMIQNRTGHKERPHMEDIHIRMPEPVSFIIHTLQEAGYEAYAVGGCVRDCILGRRPDDWDITTSAKPLEVKGLFRRTVDTGIKHGTVTVLVDKEGYEVTTYRIDGNYEDGRHPKDVTFTASLTEDLRRRDFTINAMAYNEEEGLVDIFGGLADMDKKLLRCVGDPIARFGEDALRMMRAVRFSAQLDYTIEEKTKAAIKELSSTLEKISAERIATELVKLIKSPHPDRLRACYETGLTAVFFPEFDRMMETQQNNLHHCYSVGEHTLAAMQAIPADKVLRLTMLLHDSGKPQTCTTDEDGIDHFYGHAKISGQIARSFLRRLKFDNDTIDRVVRLVTVHDVKIEPELKYMRHAMNRCGEDLFPDIFTVKQADLDAQSAFRKEEKQAQLDHLRRLYDEVIAQGSCVSLKNLAINGSDLIAGGMQPGKQLGETLKELLEMVLEDPSLNNRDALFQAAFFHPYDGKENSKDC